MFRFHKNETKMLIFSAVFSVLSLVLTDETVIFMIVIYAVIVSVLSLNTYDLFHIYTTAESSLYRSEYTWIFQLFFHFTTFLPVSGIIIFAVSSGAQYAGQYDYLSFNTVPTATVIPVLTTVHIAVCRFLEKCTESEDPEAEEHYCRQVMT